MKYALILGFVLLVFWLWRSNRQAAVGSKTSKSKKTDAKAEATEIVACELCRVHLPRADAIAGKRGLYCSIEHQQQADR